MTFKMVGPFARSIDPEFGSLGEQGAQGTLQMFASGQPTPRICGNPNGHSIICCFSIVATPHTALMPDPDVPFSATIPILNSSNLWWPDVTKVGYRIGMDIESENSPTYFPESSFLSFNLQHGDGATSSDIIHNTSEITRPKVGDSFILCYTWDSQAGVIRLPWIPWRLQELL